MCDKSFPTYFHFDRHTTISGVANSYVCILLKEINASTLGNSTSNVQIKQLLGKFIINVEQDVDLFGKVFHFSKDTPIPKLEDTPRKETR